MAKDIKKAMHRLFSRKSLVQDPKGQEAGRPDPNRQIKDMERSFEGCIRITGTEGLADWNVPDKPDISKFLRDAEKSYRESIIKEIKELAGFHSVDIPVQYGDGTSSVEKMLSLAELDTILSMVLDPEEPDPERKDAC